MKDIKVLGIDLAKNVFQLHANNAKGKKVTTKRLSRDKMIGYLSNLTHGDFTKVYKMNSPTEDSEMILR